MATIYQALSAVMQDVQGVGKTQKNNTPGQSYNFRGIDAVTNAVGPALRKHGVIVVPRIIGSEYAEVLAGAKRTPMGSARLVVEFTWYGPEGDSIVSSAAGEAFDSGDKATSKAHSVAFRTAMIQTLCLPTDEPDTDEHSYQRSAPPNPAEPTKADLARIRLRAAIKAAGGDASGVAADFLAEQGEQLRTSEKWAAIDHLAEDWEAIAESKVKA
jgi:hypothetical protein